MRSAQYPPASAEFRLRPSPSLAATWAILCMVAVLSVQLSDLTLPLRLILSLLALIAGAAAVRRFLNPRLRVRLIDDALEYQPRSGTGWRRMNAGQACFVSPWYLGWRGQKQRAYGIFRGQLADNDFRRLAVHLRHGRVD